MDLKKLVPLLCLFAVLVYGGKKLIHGLKGLINGQSSPHGEQAPVLSFGSFLEAPKAGAVNLIPSSLIPEDCRPYVRTLESLSLRGYNELEFGLTYQAIPQVPSACLITDEYISTAEKSYLKSCLLTNPTQTDFLTPACSQSILALRATLTHFLYKEKKLSEIDSLPELTDLLYFEYARGQILKDREVPPTDYSKLGSIADAILEQAPRLPAALRVKTSEAVMQAIYATRTKTLRQQDEYWETAKARLEELRKMAPGHFSILDETAAIETRGFQPNLLQSYADKLLASNPDSIRALIYSAYASWKLGDQPSAFRSLKKAIELDPKDENTRIALQALTQSGASENAFVTLLNVGLTARDFDR